MPSRLEMGDGNSVKRFLSWLNTSNEMRHLGWYQRWRATIELWFHTMRRDDESYLRVVEELGKPAVRELPERFADLRQDMITDPRDLLGVAYQEYSANDRKRLAQYFTPNSVCSLLAQMTTHDLTRGDFDKPGGLRVAEPACGSGSMIVHVLKRIKQEFGDWGLGRTVVVLTDLDIICCWMAMVQMFWFPGTLAGIHVFHGDTLGPLDNARCIGSLGVGMPPLEYVKRLRAVAYEQRIRKAANSHAR